MRASICYIMQAGKDVYINFFTYQKSRFFGCSFSVPILHGGSTSAYVSICHVSTEGERLSTAESNSDVTTVCSCIHEGSVIRVISYLTASFGGVNMCFEMILFFRACSLLPCSWEEQRIFCDGFQSQGTTH